MFELDELSALKTVLHENISILKEYKAPQLRHVPAARYMYGDKNLLNNTVIEKLGAALIRILTMKIIPEMNGITNDTVQECNKIFDEFIMTNHTALKTYKSVMVALIVSKIVSQKPEDVCRSGTVKRRN